MAEDMRYNLCATVQATLEQLITPEVMAAMDHERKHLAQYELDAIMRTASMEMKTSGDGKMYVILPKRNA